jgi:uncharacterized membrane protein
LSSRLDSLAPLDENHYKIAIYNTQNPLPKESSMSYGDDFDPYAPPKADTTVPRSKAAFGQSSNFTISDVISRSWQIFRSKMGLTIFVVFLGFILGNLLSGVAGAIDNPAAKGILQLLNSVVSFFLTAGMFTYLINLASGRDAKMGDLFSAGPILLPLIGASLLFGLVIVGAMIPAGLLFFLGPIGIFIAAIYGLVVYVLIITRLSQFYYLLIDREVGIVESLSLSNKLMKGHEVQFLGLGLVLGIMNIAGALAIGIGLLITIPLSFLCAVVYYLGITGQPVADPFSMNES